MKPLFVFLIFSALGCVSLAVALSQKGASKDSWKHALGGENLGPWKSSILEASQAPGPANAEPHSTLVLAANRTNRPDILRRFKHYHGGWDITDRHYWASVGFTGAAGFILSLLWVISFGVALAIFYCCGWRMNNKEVESQRLQKIYLLFLIVFTCSTVIGCILLSVGQDEFHTEALHTLDYVVNQSDYTVEILRNVTEYLSLAKTISVAQVFIPSDVMGDIDKLNIDLNTAANTVMEKTSENSHKAKKVFNTVRSALITVAAIMLLLSVIGLLLSILGYRHAIHIFVISGWLLVAITFLLCGMFIILDNVVSDTCMAMEEWVENPQAETALSDILPCVNQRTTNRTLTQSKRIINDIVNVVDQFVYNYANSNPSQGNPHYYNQSGPPMPALCYPFDSQLQDNRCGDLEVSVQNASMVWQSFVCEVSESGICTSVGRVTPDIYGQLTAAVNESYALQHYAPPLLRLQNCDFVRDTFQNITARYCPPLNRHLKIVNAGLGMISAGVLLCLVLWVLYANRPRREEAFVNLLFLGKHGKGYKKFSTSIAKMMRSSSSMSTSV